jgi:DNA-binding response OmpR family regulator
MDFVLRDLEITAGNGATAPVRVPPLSPPPSTRNWIAPDMPRLAHNPADHSLPHDPSVAPTRILLIDDNPHFATTLRNNLEIEGFRVDIAADAIEGLELVRHAQPTLVILDVVLPRGNGYDLLRTIRAEGIETPVVLLTARQDDAEKIRAFHLGADDFITKPVALPELMARVRAVLRRTQPAGAHALHWICIGELAIHPPTRTVQRNGRKVPLRPKEFDLLLALIRHRGRVLSRTELLRDVWGYQAGTVSRTVDTHMGTLRQKLEHDPLNPRYFITVRSAGYTLRWPTE